MKLDQNRRGRYGSLARGEEHVFLEVVRVGNGDCRDSRPPALACAPPTLAAQHFMLHPQSLLGRPIESVQVRLRSSAWPRRDPGREPLTGLAVRACS